MKKIIALALLPFLATPAMPTDIDSCLTAAEVAAKQMRIRQTGIPISEVVKHIRNLPDLDEGDVDFLIRLTEIAYMSPFYHSPEHQERETARFSDMMYQACRGR